MSAPGGAAASDAAVQPVPGNEDAATSALALGLARCGCCGLVCRTGLDDAAPHCPRCYGVLHGRKPHSVQRTVAWIITASLLYIPANVLPVMGTASVLGREQHTIIGGIAELWRSGSWELAVIVFIASIAVPILKVGALTLLAWTAARRSRWRQPERARLYRLVETVGHWSMLDVFVVVLLVGMVRFGAFATVEPEPGLLAFGAVVIATMFATAAFDPRLIWPDAPPHD
jgi:paraquat-inducible protein A